MKKILLFSVCLTAFSSFAQDFWTSKATTFPQVSRGVNDISIVDANVIWVKSYDGATGGSTNNVRQYARSIDGGNTWTSGAVNLGISQTNLNVSSISAISATTAWVTAYSSNPAAISGGVWKTINSGTTWVKQTTALFNNADSFTNLVYFWDENNGFCQGDPIGGYFELYTTTNGGATWIRVPSANIPAPLTGEYGYVHNYDVIGDIIWYGTNKGRIFKSTDKGLNWTVSQSPISDFGGTAASGKYSFKDANNGLLLESDSTPSLYKTINGGTTWTQLSFVGVMGNNDLAYIPGTNNVVTVGTDDNLTSYTSYSNDNGLTWTQTMGGTQVTTLKFKNTTTGFGGGFTTSATAGGIYKYTGTVLSADQFNANAKLALWPNPAQNIIQLSGADVSEVQVFDILGKQILSQKLSLENTLDVSSLTNGMYLLQASDADGAVSTLKFLKN